MPKIRLPDGAVKEFPAPVTVAQVASAIGPGLAKAALAGRVDGKLVDTSHPIDGDADVAIVTDKDPAGLEVLRHSTAHLLAYAVKELFPDAQVTIGPVIEDGCLISRSSAPSRPGSGGDRGQMAELAKDEPVTRKLMPRDDAVAYFAASASTTRLRSSPQSRRTAHFAHTEGSYRPAEAHVRRPASSGYSAMKLAGAYWRGDSRTRCSSASTGPRGRRRTRAYAAVWGQGALPEAGRHLDLFHEEEAPGMVFFWHPRLGDLAGGRAVRAASIATTATRKCARRKSSTARCGSGPGAGRTSRTTCSRPSRARLRGQADELPGHILIFNSDLRSYRDLPLRYGEFGACRTSRPARCTGSCACAPLHAG